MTSTTSSSYVQNLQSIVEHTNNINDEETETTISNSCPTANYRYSFQWPTPDYVTKTTRALSCNEGRIQSSTNNNNNNSRLKHLCTRLKRRFSISKEYRTRNEDMNRGLSIRFKNYKSFSSSLDDSYNEFEWPDFEQIYDTIPSCLTKALPGLDDFSVDDDDENDDDGDYNQIETPDFLTDDETDEQLHLYEDCKRGRHFRRNAICHKLDKSLYKGQLNTFVQQLMIEKLMRTWT